MQVLARPTHKFRWTPRAAIAAIALAALVAIPVLPASAKGRKPAAPTGTASVSAPANVAIGQVFAVTGSGFNPAYPVWMRVTDASGSGTVSAGFPDASGNVAAVHWVEWVAGDATVTLMSNTGYPDTTSLTPEASAVVHVS